MKILSLFLALNVLVASTGLSLHTHTCSASDVTVVNLTETGCKSEEMKKMDCCKPATDCGSEKGEDGCCSDEQQYYKEDLLGTLTNKDQVILPVEYSVLLALNHELWSVDRSVAQGVIFSGLPPGAFHSPPSVLFQVFRC